MVRKWQCSAVIAAGFNAWNILKLRAYLSRVPMMERSGCGTKNEIGRELEYSDLVMELPL
jgi:hypothetical protein